MAHVRTLGPKRYQARWTDPSGKPKTKVFAKKSDAEKHLVAMSHAKMSGTYIDAALGRATVEDVAEQWMAGKVNAKPSTRARQRSVLDVHVLPRWSGTPVARIEHSAAQAWVAQLVASGLSAATVRKTHGVFSGVLALAVKDRRIASNPCDGVNLPRVASSRRKYLTAAQVADLAKAAATPTGKSRGPRTSETFAQNGLVVYTLAYCGLRWGELAALRVSSVDLLRRRINIAESVSEVDGEGMVWTTPKDHEARSVGIPLFLVEAFAAHMTMKERSVLLFPSPAGQPLSHRSERRAWFNGAANAIGVPGLTPHELRHTAASLAVSVGANVKAVQRMLGHASAAMTLDTYADLFDDDLDAVADRLDELARVNFSTGSESRVNPAPVSRIGQTS